MQSKLTTTFLLIFICFTFPKITIAQIDYKVQVAAYDRSVPLNYFSGLNKVKHVVDKNGFHKYYLDGFKTRDAAMTMANEVQRKGYHAVLINQSLNSYLCRNSCAAPASIDEIKPIFFDFDQSNLRSTSVRELEKLHQILINQPSVSVTFRAHTDAKGSNLYNQQLSERRALAAKNYLMDKGIPSYRVTTSIHGEVEPVAINHNYSGQDSPNGRQLNRRVEIEIYDKSGQPLNVKVAPIKVPSYLSINTTVKNKQG